jgi:hypothetical protein
MSFDPLLISRRSKLITRSAEVAVESVAQVVALEVPVAAQVEVVVAEAMDSRWQMSMSILLRLQIWLLYINNNLHTR